MAEPVVTFTLPPFPSTNETKRDGGGHGHTSRVTRQWRECGKLTAMNALATLGLEPPMLKYARIVLTEYPRDLRRDLLNLDYKAAIDGMADAGLFANDRGVVDFQMRRRAVDKLMPRVEVEIYEVKE